LENEIDKMNIRPANIEDVKQIFEFVKIIAVKETNNVISLPEEFSSTIADQEKWIRYYSENENALLLVAETEGKIVGVLDFKTHPKIRMSHSGEFGISILPEYQNQKIGSKMIEFLLQWTTTRPKIKKINLCVFHPNTRAIHVYKKLGFEIEGVQVGAVQISQGEFIDLVMMARVV